MLHPDVTEFQSGLVKPLALALVIWAVYLLVSPQVLAAADQLPAFLENGGGEKSVATVLFGLALVLLSLPVLGRCFRWLGRQQWRVFDSGVGFILLSGLFLLGLNSWYFGASSLGFLLWPPTLFAVLFCLVRIALLAYRKRRSSEPVRSEYRSIFDQVLEEGGSLAPLDTEEDDELERAPLVDELYLLVTRSRTESMNFGVEGAWGSGKTSLLRMLRSRLADDGFSVVGMDLWSYRQPNQMIRAFFEQIGRALDQRAPELIPSRILRRLGSGLLELGGSRAASATRAILPDLFHESLDSLKIQLRDVLSGLEKPIIVIIDDLDRTDRNELVAILRSVNLLSHLPNLNMILAYDWSQVAAILFPDTDEELRVERARDHLAKVVNYELALGLPPRDLLENMVEDSLRPLLDRVEDERQLEDFVRRFNDGDAYRELSKSLPTPREIRRIAAATAARWHSMKHHLNLFDLFVLTVVQYRAPVVYREIRKRPEVFVEVEWSEEPVLRLSARRRDELREEGRALLEKLSGTWGGNGIANLLREVFLNLKGESIITNREARSRRVAMHPALIERYFTLYIPRKFVSEREIERYAEDLREKPSGRLRRRLLVEIVRDEKEKGRLDSFLDQWQLEFSHLSNDRRDDHASEQYHSKELVRDLALGFAEASNYFSTDHGGYFRSQSARAARRVLFIATHLPEEDVAEILCEAINKADNIVFIRWLVEYSVLDKLPPVYQRGSIAEQSELRECFARKVVGEFGSNPVSLLKLSPPERYAVLFATESSSSIPGLFLSAINENPELLPRVLDLAAFGREHVVDIGSLSNRLDVTRLHEATKHLELDSWSDATDSALVGSFRTSVSQAGTVGA